MYNFLDCKLKPFVKADCPSTDGYEVTNLISANVDQKTKGFLAYTAIKPPINVDFEFICPVNIYCIIIGTTIGSQKSTGLEFLIKNSNSEYSSLAKVYTDDAGIIIYNRKYYSQVQQKCNIPENFATRFCRSNLYKNITNVEKFRVRILRTKSSVPCIETIEIWGEISRTCSDVTKNTIKQLLVNDKHDVSKHDTKIVIELSKISNNLNIPEEFIDPISCEIMSLPMTLPCGKTVDQITLEKHQESEAKWGRSASDPFTGQLFTLSRKPVLNTALKGRIDEFLFQNSHREETFCVQRTLGRGGRGQNTTKHINVSDINMGSLVEPSTSSSSASSSSNLDELISNAMKQYNIVRFTDQNEINCKNKRKECGSCSTELNLYELECKHFLCRSCVLKMTYCETCNTVITKCCIKKFHNL